jgi:hypothetical protein
MYHIVGMWLIFYLKFGIMSHQHQWETVGDDLLLLTFQPIKFDHYNHKYNESRRALPSQWYMQLILNY